MEDMKMLLIKKGFTAEEIDANPEVLEIMKNHLLQGNPPFTRKASESKKLNSLIKAQINVRLIHEEVASLKPAYLRIKLKMEGFTHHHIVKYPELVELKRASILKERLKKNEK